MTVPNPSQPSSDHLALLYRLSHTFNSSLDLDEVITVTRAERGFVMLHEADGRLVFRAARGMAQNTIDDPQFQVSRSVVERVAREGKPILTSDAQSDDRFSRRQNVMIAADGTAKLTDFGLARTITSRFTTEGMIIGTVFYLAPEQALGQEIDNRVDLYTLGIVLYELTTGQLPFADDDVLTVISQHLHAPVVPPSTHNAAIPPALDALIVQLLNKRPEDRPASAAQVRHRLDSLLRPKGALRCLWKYTPTTYPRRPHPLSGARHS